MGKTIIREIIISLLVCLAVIILLSVMFYNFIPNNKVLPEKVTYQASEEIKSEVNSEVDNSSDLIIKTYEITASDLEGFEKTDQYNPGRANPFAPITNEEDEVSGDINTTPGEDTSGESVGNSGSSSGSGSNNGGGTLFEDGNSK